MLNPVEANMPHGETPSRPATGTVRWFNIATGHGFVTCDAGGPDCFLHQSSICEDDQCRIEEGTRVAFDVVEGLGGPLTINVRRL
jgi:CspA family cold shock protein